MNSKQTPPILEALKKHNEPLTGFNLLKLPADSDFGNLNVSWMDIVQTVDCMNDLIITTYSDFYIFLEKMKNNPMISPSTFFKQSMRIEEIFYWVRKSADQMISLMWILHYHNKEGKYPSKIKVSSIGHFLNENEIFDNQFEKHIDLLKKVNEISNGYKHSFINSQINSRIGIEYPVVFAYTLEYNNLKKEPKFYTLNLKEVLNDFNDFLIEAREFLKEKFEIV